MAYTSPSNVSHPVQQLATGTQVEPLCFTEGQDLNGRNIWFRVSTAERPAYLHCDSIAASGDIRHC